MGSSLLSSVFLIISLLVCAMVQGTLAARSPRRSTRKWKTRGHHSRNKRQLHPHDEYGGHGGKGGGAAGAAAAAAGDDGRSGFFTSGGGKGGRGKAALSGESGRSADGTGRSVGGGKGKGKHIHAKTPNTAVGSPGTAIYSSMSYTTRTSMSELAYANKCDAAEAGAEFKTSSYVPVYYQYEVVTSSTRDVLEVADIIDKACQHFLAIWMVDCDSSATTTTTASSYTNTYNNNGGGRDRRQLLQHQGQLLQSKVYPKFHRTLQMTLAPIVGVGVGDWDTVLGLGTGSDRCTTLASSVALGQACYKVVGSLLIYLDESMQVTPDDVQMLAFETLTVGMNYGTTDFTQLDEDILQLQFIQGYGTAPQEVLQANWAANQRSWDTSNNQGNGGDPFDDGAGEPSVPVSSTKGGGRQGRSGGAKFGIAFATLLCIAIAAFLAVYVYQNRDQLFNRDGSPPPKKGNLKNQDKHHNLDDQTTQASKASALTKYYDPKKARVYVEDTASHGEVNVTFHSIGGRSIAAGSQSPDGGDSVATRPLSPEPETPRPPTIDETRSYMIEESNIITPRSDWSSNRSTISEITEPIPMVTETPIDRPIRINLSKEKIRSSSSRKNRNNNNNHRAPQPTGTGTRASEYVSPERDYQVGDTVQL